MGRMFAHLCAYPELQLLGTQSRPQQVLSEHLWWSVDDGRGSSRSGSNGSPFLSKFSGEMLYKSILLYPRH